MEIEAAKMIGAGLAAIGLAGVGVGIGNVFATTIATIGRNPSIQNRVAGLMWIGFALVEAIGLFALWSPSWCCSAEFPGAARPAAAAAWRGHSCRSSTRPGSPARSSG